MEALYQSFMAIPIESVGILGLVQMIFIVGALIFKLEMSAPKKEKIDLNRQILTDVVYALVTLKFANAHDS